MTKELKELPSFGSDKEAEDFVDTADLSEYDLSKGTMVKITVGKPVATPRTKTSYVGAPAIFKLELECQHINRAFGGYGCYHVGSSLERADWRDVDVRLIMGDAEFRALFPDVIDLSNGSWEFDPRWLLLTTMLSDRLSKETGLPIDFQFQPQTHANKRHPGERNALGLLFTKDPA